MSVDLLPVPFGERVAEQPTVFFQKFRVSPVTEALAKRSGTFDVGEEEG